MADTLARIKRAVLSGRYVFTDKASAESEADGLTELDMVEAIANAAGIYKTLRSIKPGIPGARECLYVIVSPNLSGFPIYTKGKLVRKLGLEHYTLISTKRAIR